MLGRADSVLSSSVALRAAEILGKGILMPPYLITFRSVRRLLDRLGPLTHEERCEAVASLREVGMLAGYPGVSPGGAIWQSEGLVLHAIVRALRPRLVIETGTATGASAAYISAGLRRNGTGRYISIDVAPASNIAGLYPPTESIAGDSLAWLADNVSLVKQCDLFFHDSDHSAGHVAAELELVMPHLRPGALIVAHDAYSVRWNPSGGDGLWKAFERSVAPSLAFRAMPLAVSNCGLAFARVGLVHL